MGVPLDVVGFLFIGRVPARGGCFVFSHHTDRSLVFEVAPGSDPLQLSHSAMVVEVDNSEAVMIEGVFDFLETLACTLR